MTKIVISLANSSQDMQVISTIETSPDAWLVCFYCAV